MEDLRFVILNPKASTSRELMDDRISSLKQEEIGIPGGRLDYNSTVIHIGDETCSGKFKMELPEDRRKVYAGKDREQRRPLADTNIDRERIGKIIVPKDPSGAANEIRPEESHQRIGEPQAVQDVDDEIMIHGGKVLCQIKSNNTSFKTLSPTGPNQMGKKRASIFGRVLTNPAELRRV